MSDEGISAGSNRATLIRLRHSDHGTEGLMISRNFHCYSLELPWQNNQRNISCIPSGTYTVQIRISQKYGRVYWITEVPDRSFILIHSGNWAGDGAKGLKTHTNGCILLGKYAGILQGQRAVLCSRPSITTFQNLFQGQSFQLKILDTIAEV
ncbi:hypothetical protein KKC74_14880 [bacterium]|nr:hypothetical protein [bacterium]